MLVGLGLVLLLVAITAYFVAVEFSLVSIRPTRVDQLVSERRAGATQVKRAIDNLQTYLAAAQIGITMASLGLGALGEPVVAQMISPLLEAVLPHEWVEQFISIHGIAFVIALLLVTIVELVLGETVPKIAAIQRAEAVGLVAIRPMFIFIFLLKPLVWIINLLSNGVLRLLGLPPDEQHGSVYSVEELEMLVTSSRKAGVLDRDEEVILRRVFDFGDLTARQVMRPRTEIDAIELHDSLDQVIKTIAEDKHSRLPVYSGDLDSIVGILHVKDLFMVMANMQGALASNGNGISQSIEPFSVEKLMRPVEAVPETLDVADLLNRMQQGGHQMAVVIDEYGGTAGIVTLEDIVEEIVGEVRDEFEPANANAPDIMVTPDGTMVNGLTAIDDVNEKLGLNIESESDTIGGFVFGVLGRKPELGNEVTHKGFILRVEALDGLRIAKVKITQRQSQAERESMEAVADEA